MLEYIYFVKCPGCEDEPFDFFNEAKDFALSCLGQKPIITQIEVDRNDFGECVDSCDLGTVWSWEDMMKDVPADDTPDKSIFTKDDLKHTVSGQDPEFDNIDNSLDFDTAEDAIDFLVKDEEEAIASYKKVEAAVEDFDVENKKEILGTLGHIKEEEEEHIKELEALLGVNEAKSELVETVDDFQRKLIDRLPKLSKEEFQKMLKNGEPVKIFYGDPQELGIRSRDYEVAYFDSDGTYEVTFWDETYYDEFTESELVEKFYSIDELWDYMVEFMKDTDFSPEYNYIAESSDSKPVPTDMTVEELVEEMEENEDIVECKWCNELFDKSECRYEVDLGWLCGQCEAAIKSRGEELTFRENAHGDFLDESIENKTLSELVADSIYHLTHDLGKDPWAEDFADDVIADLEDNYESAVPEDFNKYQEWCSAVACEVSRQVNNNITEAFNLNSTVEFNYTDLNVTLNGPKRAEDDWDSEDRTVAYTFTRSREDVATAIWENFLTEADAADVPGGIDTLEDDKAWNAFLEVHFDDLLDKYYDKLLDYYREDAREEYMNSHSLSEAFDTKEKVEFIYDGLTITVAGNKRDVDDWDEVEHTDSYSYFVSKGDVATDIWENFITDEDAVEVPGGLDTLESDKAWDAFLETNFDKLLNKYYDQLLDYYREYALKEFQDSYSWDDLMAEREAERADRAYDEQRDRRLFGESKEKIFLEEFDDEETHKASLIDCPECGSPSYDMKEQYCTNCGLGL